MLVRQSINTFIRCNGDFGYITNQLTRLDRIYNETGTLFLQKLSRIPQRVEDIVESLCLLFKDVDKEMLHDDFMEFINELSDERFVVIGENEDELDNKELRFTYKNIAPSFLVNSTNNQHLGIKSTHEYFVESLHGRPFVAELHFELSSRCNERCIHCYIPNGNKDKGFEMPLPKVKSVIHEFAQMGGLGVALSGGEAFLHKDLMEICKFCREEDLQIAILSNLISLRDEHIPVLKSLNLKLIQVSLYSMDPVVHDHITSVKGSFQRTKSAIEKLVAADIPVQISCPLMKANKEGYEKVLAYGQSLGVKAQTDFIMMAQADMDTSNLANRLSLEETEKVIRDIIEHDSNYREMCQNVTSVTSRMEQNLELFLKDRLCGAGYDTCCIATNGDVYPCAGWQDYVLGNVYKQSLSEIWMNSEKAKTVRNITQADFPQCLNCEAIDYCNRCLVRNYNENGGDMFHTPKHFCDVAFLNKRLVEEYRAKGLI